MMRSDDFQRLYEAHAKPLFAFLEYRTGSSALAEDLLADTFERVLRTRRPFDRRKASETTWIYTIAHNCLRDHSRRRAAESRAMARVAAGAVLHEDPPGEQIGTRDALMRSMEALSAEERDVIALRYGADLTVPQIASLSKQKLTTVQGRLYRALGKLRDQFS